MQTLYSIGLSGGKDSTALFLWALFESGLPRESLRPSFCDTSNEHEFTYAHIRMLSDRFMPIVTLKPERGFYDLARWKKRFPGVKSRFCTQRLKMFPSQEYAQQLGENGDTVIMLSGVRSDESADRSKLPEKEFDGFYGLHAWRPLLRWKLEDVLAIHKRHNVPLNPLYSYGATRVGCFPCIMSRKAEIRMIAAHFPERIDKIREEEKSFDSINGISTFFARKTVPERFRSKAIKTKKGEIIRVATIDDVVLWSKTERGGKQYDFDFDRRSCPSSLGACE